MIEIHENITACVTIWCPAACISDMRIYWTKPKWVTKVSVKSQLFSSVKSEPAWLHPKFGAEKYFFRMNIDRTSNWSLQMETGAIALFSGSHASSIQFPFKVLTS